MSRLKEKHFQTVVLVGLALTVGCAQETSARMVATHTNYGGHSGGGHVNYGHYDHSSYGHRNRNSGGYYNPNGWGNGGGGSYGGYYGGQDYPQPGPPGQVFSGPAHIDPSQYNNYVQTYQWPSHQ